MEKPNTVTDPTKFKLEPVGQYELPIDGQKNTSMPVQVSKIGVEMRKVNDEVRVYAKNIEFNKLQRVGTLPQSFLANNPMNVNRCKADITVEDYSNGKKLNVSERLIVDSDLMSGDVIELSDDMLSALKQNDQYAIDNK